MIIVVSFLCCDPSARTADRSTRPTPGRRHAAGAGPKSAALPLAPPAWAKDARAWDIREGVYIAFTDGTYRLVPRREYYDFARAIQYAGPPIARQGDLLVFCQQLPEDMRAIYRRDGVTSDGIDHHVMENGAITHPEHGSLILPENWQTIILAPGSSRPFARSGGVD